MICDKTTQWAFPTLLTTLATNTTLGTATRHDFAAITIHTPEAPSGSFAIKSAIVVVTVRDAFTVATDFDGARIGIKLGAVGFDDSDQTFTLAHTNDHETLTVQRDVTSYFIANFGTAASQTCQVGVAFATGVASLVNNITCELFITYDYNNAAATHCKTVEFPIQGEHTTIGTTATEIGTAGTSPAAVNQIPDLTGVGAVLPEAGITIRQCYLRITATDGGNSTTDFNLFAKIDSGGVELTRATLEQALSSCAGFKDIVDLVAYGMVTSSAHALFLRSSLASTFQNVSAVLVVTYTFTTAGTTREFHSVRTPFINDRGNLPPHVSNTAGDEDRLSALLEIQEPGTITMVQSGAVIEDNINSGVLLTVYAPGQAARTFNHAGFVYSSGAVLVRRCDHDSSSWSLARGSNRLNLDFRIAGASTLGTLSAFALVNYTADVPTQGCGAGNRTVFYPIADNQTEGNYNYSTPSVTPSFPTTPWVVSGAPFIQYMPRGDMRAAAFVVGAERAVGEDSGDGWASQVVAFSSGNVKATRRSMIVPADWFDLSSFDARSAMSLTASRRWKSVGSILHNWAGHLCFTFSQCQFTVSGTLTIGGVPATDGKTIKVWAYNGSDAVEYIGSTATAGGAGAFTFNAPDNTRTYFCTHHNGPSDYGSSQPTTPGGSFSIAIGGAGGSNTYSKSRVVNA